MEKMKDWMNTKKNNSIRRYTETNKNHITSQGHNSRIQRKVQSTLFQADPPIFI